MASAMIDPRCVNAPAKAAIVTRTTAPAINGLNFASARASGLRMFRPFFVLRTRLHCRFVDFDLLFEFGNGNQRLALGTRRLFAGVFVGDRKSRVTTGADYVDGHASKSAAVSRARAVRLVPR